MLGLEIWGDKGTEADPMLVSAARSLLSSFLLVLRMTMARRFMSRFHDFMWPGRIIKR